MPDSSSRSTRAPRVRARSCSTSRRAVAVAQREFPQHFPQPGWVEHDADEIWATQAGDVTEALARARADRGATSPRSASPTSARPRWSGTARPASPVAPRDRLAGPAHGRRCERLQADGHEAEVAASAPGCCSIRISPAPSSRWLLDNVAGRAGARRARRARLRHDRQLAGLEADAAARRTSPSHQRLPHAALQHPRRGDWDDDLLELLRIPRALLPEVVPSSASAARRSATLGGGDVPIAGIAGDQQAALFGQACFEPGMAKNTYGTGCFLLMNTGAQPLASRQPAAHDRRLADATARTTTRSKAASSSPAPSCSGCATASGSSSTRREVEALAAQRARQRRRLSRAGLHRARRAALGPVRARHDRRPHARHDARAHRARGARGHRLPDAEVLAAMQADAGMPLLELRVDGGATAQRPADAVPGRSARRARRAARRSPRRPRSAPPTWPGSASGSGSSRRSSPPMAGDRRFEPAMSRDEAAAGHMRAGPRQSTVARLARPA